MSCIRQSDRDGEGSEVDLRTRPGRTCYDCVFAHWDADRWRAEMNEGWANAPLCANREGTPGRLRVTPLGRVCRNFQARRRSSRREDPPPPPNGEVRYIALTQGQFAIVDACDYERLSRHRWCAVRSGDGYYARRSVPGGTILMHREIMKAPKGMVVDHIDGNRLDNRSCNLRVCTPQQNECNKPPRGRRSRFKGVYPHRDKWQATIRHAGRTYYLGLFDDEVEAARARDRKARQLQGEFAYLNFPEETQV
jgi:hypothetical protein